MIEQRHEEGQSVRLDALFVERQDEAAAGGVDQVIAVLDALGDALGRDQFADVVARQERRQRFGGNMRVDGQALPLSRSAGSLPERSENSTPRQARAGA